MRPAVLPFPRDMQGMARRSVAGALPIWGVAAWVWWLWDPSWPGTPEVREECLLQSALTACLLFVLALASLSLALRLWAWALTLSMRPISSSPEGWVHQARNLDLLRRERHWPLARKSPTLLGRDGYPKRRVTVEERGFCAGAGFTSKKFP